MEAAEPDLGFLRIDPALWAQVRSESIDYAVMEQAQNVSVVRFAGGWSDLGSWEAVWQESPQDGDGNALAGLSTAIVIFLLRGVFRQIMIVYPLVKHFAESFELHNPALVEGVRQRDKDQRTDGGGFAEALGAGGAF